MGQGEGIGSPGRRDRLPTPVFFGFPGAQTIISLQCRRPRFNPWVGKILQRREEIPTSENSMDLGAWQATVHGGHKELDRTEWLSLHFYIFFTRSSIDRHLGCFYISAIANNAVMDVGVLISLWDKNGFISFGFILRSGIAESCNSFIFYFLSNFHTVIYSGCTILHSYQHCTDFIFSISSLVFISCLFK